MRATIVRWSLRKAKCDDDEPLARREGRDEPLREVGAPPARRAGGQILMWRLRVVHSTGYAYKSPVTASFNEARLTPRSDSRQNVILNRVETVPATRSYRYVDYWGTAVTAFDLHAPHTELEVTSSSVVEDRKSVV